MKKIALYLLLVMLVSALVSAQDLDAPQLNITLLNQDPDPVDPGQYVELRFKIVNNEAGTIAENLEVRLQDQYPFYLDESEKSLRTVGDLPALGNGQNIVIVKYKVRVAEDAVEGENPLRLEYRHGNTPWLGKEFNVDVQTVDANLAITQVATNPEMIEPGEEVELGVTVQNMADSTMRDVTLKLDLTFSNLPSTTASDALNAFNSLPFAPLGSATEKKVYSLEPGDEHTFTYQLIAFSDAEARIYKVPIEITYYDELETRYEKQDIIGLIVGTQPDMSVVIDENDLMVGQRTGTVTFRFINKGFSDIKFLDVTLDDNGEYEVLSSNEVYVGNVDSDDYETADYDLYLKNGAAEEETTVTLPLNVEYRDANNNLYTETYNLDMKVYPAEKLGEAGQGSILPLVVILVLVIGGVWFFRRRRKKRK